MPGPDDLDPDKPAPEEPATERVRIFGAEIAGNVVGEPRAPDAAHDAPGDGDADGGSVDERYLGFSHRVPDEGVPYSSSGEVTGRLDPTASGEPSGPVPFLPHWTDPPTGQVPAVVARHDDDERTESWGSGGPSWREHDHEWEDTEFEPSLLGGEDPRLGALEETPLSERRPWEFGDLSSSGQVEMDESELEPEDETRAWEARSRWSEDTGDRGGGERWWDEEEDAERGYWLGASMSEAKDPRPAIHTKPRIVVVIPSTGDPFSAPARYQTIEVITTSTSTKGNADTPFA